MPRMRKSYAVFGVVPSFVCGFAAVADNIDEPRVVKIEVRMQTTGDGKNGNTQVLDAIVLKDGRQAAGLNCCSSGNSGGDVWDAGRDETRPFNRLTPGITKSQIHGATVKFGMRSNGNDKWQFTPTLMVTYDKGNPESWGFGNFYLKSGGGYTDRVFPIPR